MKIQIKISCMISVRDKNAAKLLYRNKNEYNVTGTKRWKW